MPSPVHAVELPPARWLYRSRPAAFLWLAVRLALGWGWLSAGWDKLAGPNRELWMGDGAALRGFVQGALAQTQGKNPDVAYGWYTDFLGWVGAHAAPMAKLVALGEVAVGVLLLLGCLTGLAALLGATMNVNYLLAGSAGVNPVYLLAAFGLMLAWRNAGHLGLDRYLLPALFGRNVRSGHRGNAEKATERMEEPVTV
jgi:thiosulfate dehydrogenase [quinone] large subunit